MSADRDPSKAERSMADLAVAERHRLFVDYLSSNGVVVELTSLTPGSREHGECLRNRLWALTLAMIYMSADLDVRREPDRRKEIWQTFRDTAFKQLYVAGLYREPWLSLVSREFPGTGPTEADEASFANAIGDEVERVLAGETEAARIKDLMLERLHAAGYHLNEGDQRRTAELAWLVSCEMPASTRLMRAQSNISQMRRPKHEVWPVIIAEFFPV